MKRLVFVAALLVAILASPPAMSVWTHPDPPGTGVVLIDTVESLTGPTSFRLTSQVVVETGLATLFVGVVSVGELRPGDLVQVGGEWAGEILVAATVELLQSGSSPAAVTGLIAYLIPDQSTLVLSDGTLGRVHPGTVYVAVDGFDDLAPGDQVAVEGLFDPWNRSLLVDRLELLAASLPGGYLAFPAVVAAVLLPDRVELDDGGILILDSATVLWSFAALADLEPGDLLWVEALTTATPGVYAALSLALQEGAPTSTAFQATVASVDPSGSFTTLEGTPVLVDDTTLWVGLTGLDQLRPGDVVWVEGEVAPDLSVYARLVQLVGDGVGDEPGGLLSGLVGTVDALLPPHRFMTSGLVLTTDATTQWRGTLAAYGDLAVGAVVSVETRWLPGGEVLALAVEGLAEAQTGLLTLSGTVTFADPPAGSFQLEGGEWVHVEPGTPVDGDVDSPAEITAGMLLTADCVPLGGQDFRALRVVVTDRAFYFPAHLSTTREALVVTRATASAEAVAARHGATVAGRLPGTLVHLFSWAEPVTEDEVRLLSDDPEVEDVEVNYSFFDPEAIRRRMPTVDHHASSASFRGQPAATVAGLAGAHSRSSGEGTLVAVLDNGVDPLHPLLRHRLASGWDFVDDDDEPWEEADGVDQDGDGDVDEAAGHGTFVAGLVLLAAPRATILPLRVLDSDGNGTTFAICQAVLTAVDRGADVVNMSFAYDTRSRVLDRILDEASARGVILVSGAGNDSSPELPFPARDHRVIAVAAVDSDLALAGFSNHGSAVVLAAPGVDTVSSLDLQRFGRWSGTSMAAPLVSGVAALLRSVDPYLTPAQVRDALTQSAAPLTGDPHGVAGALQADAALDLIPGRP